MKTKETILVSENTENENSKTEVKKGFDFGTVKTDNVKKPNVSSADKSEIDTMLSGYTAGAIHEANETQQQGVIIPKPKRRNKKKMDAQFISGDIISGALFLTFIDMLLPMAIATANNTLSDDKVSAKSMQLTQTQKNELEPIADALMKEIQIKANPLVILIVSMISVYGMNFVQAKFSLE